MVKQERPEVDIAGIEEHMARLRDKQRHLEGKINMLCMLVDKEPVSFGDTLPFGRPPSDAPKSIEEKIIHLKFNEFKLVKVRGQRLKSKAQSYDIRDHGLYAGVLEIEQLLRQ